MPVLEMLELDYGLLELVNGRHGRVKDVAGDENEVNILPYAFVHCLRERQRGKIRHLLVPPAADVNVGKMGVSHPFGEEGLFFKDCYDGVAGCEIITISACPFWGSMYC